uniref:Lysozyme n=1 Tax=Rhabditophanes sp. KR3021 TaxID=114890 RepID=A0AC35TIE4_9BILA
MFVKLFALFLVATVLVQSTAAAFAYGVDISQGASVANFQCLLKSGYKTVFTQVYINSGNGLVDTAGIQNVKNAYSAGMGTEVFISPSPNSNKQGYQQFDETLAALKKAGINVRTIWLKVSYPIHWSNNLQYNVNFIQSIITRAKSNAITVGIYTNFYDWAQITGSTTAFTQYKMPLWYWGILGYGPSAEGTADFKDFRAFASWNAPAAKEYASTETACGQVIGKIAYTSTSKFEQMFAKLTAPLAGSAIY